MMTVTSQSTTKPKADNNKVTYKVTVCHEVWNYYEVEVEAPNEDAACNVAVQKFDECGAAAFRLIGVDPQQVDVISVRNDR